MDLSPSVINRKQDITSWPDGDLTQLTTRDKNRYQKRKSAIRDYFETELSAEEISLNYRLTSTEALEPMARRCLLLHEDGRPWGFRALVPGATVTDQAAESTGERAEVVVKETTSPVATTTETVVTQEKYDLTAQAEDDEDLDTAKRQAIKLVTRSLEQLPLTPVPEVEVSEQADAERVDALALPPDPLTSVDKEEQTIVPQDQAVVEVAETPLVTEETDLPQEDFPSIMFAPTASLELTDKPGLPSVEEPGASAIPVAAEMQADERLEVATLDTVEVASVRVLKTADEQSTRSNAPADADGDDVLRVVEPEPVAVVIESDAEQVEQAPEQVASGEPVEVVGVGEVEESTQIVEDKPVEAAGRSETEQILENEPVEVVAASEVEESTQVLEETPAPEPVVTAGRSETEQIVEDEPVEVVAASEVEESTQVLEDRTVAAAGRSEVERVREEMAETETVVVAAVHKVGQAERDRDALAATETVEVLAVQKVAQNSLPATETHQTPTTVLKSEETAKPAITTAQAEEMAIDTLPTRTLEAQRRDSRQLSMARPITSPKQSLSEESRYQITGKQTVIKQSVRRRWYRQGQKQRQRRWTRIISAAIVASLLVILLIPLSVGLVGYNAYTNIKGVAQDGVNHLLALKNLVPASKSDVTAILNIQKLNDAKTNIDDAQDDFLQLQDMVNRPDIQSLLQQFAPQYSNELTQARSLIQVALDVTYMGQELIGVGQMGANILHGAGSLLSSGSTTPLLTSDNINTIEAALVHTQYYIGDIQTQMGHVNLSALPLGNASQKAELAKYLGEIPTIQSTISQAQTLIGPVSWLLGVGQQRTFLVQTLDRGELRPSGGFEGQYGTVSVQNGRMGAFSLRDITLLDYDENGVDIGNTPPPQYSWMNFGSFGVRDANLSADYPTTAKIVTSLFQQEGGGPVDGDIQITPVVIEQFLQLTGPLYIQQYNDTVTAQNLEVKLHAYQQQQDLIDKQQQVTGTDSHSTRKAFTNLVGTLIMARAKKLTIPQLLDFGKVLLTDLKSRDLQIYFTNPVAEQWLTQNGDSGAMPQFTNGTDGFMVVQSNISISKAAQYVKSTFNDQVTLQSNGDAVHNLTITLNYQQTGPVYGFNSYADYLRLYVPSNAQFQGAYGFNTGTTLCTPGQSTSKTGTGKGTVAGSYTDAGLAVAGGCSQYYYSYPDSNDRYCGGGNYQLGIDGMQDKAWPYKLLGGPGETSSDLPGYQMVGGLTLTPKNCVSTLTFSWVVPHAVQNVAGQTPYQMVVGHQAGWPDITQVSIDASALKGVKSLTYDKTIDVDTLISLANRPLPPSQKPTTPTPVVTPTSTPKKP